MGTSDSFAKINLICQICQRVRSVSESDLWSVRPCGRPWESNLWARPHRFESPIGLSRTAGDAVRSLAEAMHLAEDRTASPAVRERPIGLSNLWGRARTPTASHHKVMWSVWEAVLGLSRPHRSASQIGLSNLWGRESPWEAVWESDRPLMHTDRTLPAEAMRLAVKSVRRPRGSDCIARCAWEADRHLRLPRPHRSERPCAWAFSMYFCVWEAKFVRPWEAVRGCAPLIGSDRSHDKSERPWEAVRGPCSSHWLRDLWNICVFSTFLTFSYVSLISLRIGSLVGWGYCLRYHMWIPWLNSIPTSI